MSESGLFAQVVEKLLQGQCICEYAHEVDYLYLLNPTSRQEVENYLLRINRRLRKTQDNNTFYCAYAHLDNPSYKSQVRSQFSEVVNDLEPLVRWLNLCQANDKNSRPLTAGDQIKESSLLAALENTTAIGDELAKLSHSTLLKNNQSTAKGQLSAILRKLCEHGYLIANNQGGSQYTATGKWSRLYDLMAFISSHEQLDNEDNADQQEMAI